MSRLFNLRFFLKREGEREGGREGGRERKKKTFVDSSCGWGKVKAP
jgi:hypothetical protein